MYDGEEQNVVLRCKNHRMREMVDRFGDEIESEALDDEYFRMKVHVTVSHGFFSWLFQFAVMLRFLSRKW